MLRSKFTYFYWALSRFDHQDFTCPSCHSATTHEIKRKMVVTALRECISCGMRFRVPKEEHISSERFYQKKYNQGFTTDCPDDEELHGLLARGFKGSQKDYSVYIDVARAAGLKSGDSILDFGCSWGYGSWQLQAAGFNVYSYDISLLRLEYAAQKLNCLGVNRLDELPTKVDCFFNAHVIEHLVDPNVLWLEADKALNPEGVLVCFMPNGEPELEKIYGTKKYHQLWGRVHPLLMTKNALVKMAERYGFRPFIYSSPYSIEKILFHNEDDQLLGDELLLIARRC